MIGIVRAEILRLRKRGSLLLLAGFVPVLATIFFGLGYASIFDVEPFDEAGTRQMLIDSGYVIGLPPDEAERLLGEYIENERRNHDQQLEQVKLVRATFTFPQSIVSILGSAYLLVFALALLTATTIGDEFGWATIRTTLLANSHRWRVLLVRLGGLMTVAALIMLLMVLVGVIAPLFLNVAAKPLPSPLPPVDVGALLVFCLGILFVSFAIISFATLVTLIVRNGALTLVSLFVYVVVEGAVLALLSRFKEFGFDYASNKPGELAWLLDALPAHGFVTLMDVGTRASRAAVGPFEGQSIPPISDAYVAMIGFVAWGAVFALLAFWRFRRMDIVE
jgi:ABC-type transport system involved in multi-copper enzyme maturation permease subunit